MTTDARIRDEAIDWRIRLAGGGAADWESFVEWLERSPDHARAYDLVARNRYRWFGRSDTCWLPAPEHAARFLS